MYRFENAPYTADFDSLQMWDMGMTPAGCSKRVSKKAAGREEARHMLRYVESLREVRMPPANFSASY